MRLIASLINFMLQIYLWIVIIRAVLSWIRPNPDNPIVRFIYGLVDPLTYKISKVIPTRFGMMDFAPVILIVLILIVQTLVVRLLLGTAIYF
jgi:YggT family protein